MKNSLFKRAIAAAAAVPIALTQCLAVANAAEDETPVTTTTTSSSKETIALKGKSGLLYIEPTDGISLDATYTREGNTFTKCSDWNTTVHSKIVGKNVKSDSIDPADFSDVTKELLPHAGNFSGAIEGVLENVHDVTYEIAENGDITFKGKVSDIIPGFVGLTKRTSNTPGDCLYALAEQYNVPELTKDRAAFDGLTAGGEFTLVVKASSLVASTSAAAELTLKDLDGNEHKDANEISAYCLGKLEEVRKGCYKAIEDNAAAGNIDVADAKARVDSKINKYTNNVKRATNQANQKSNLTTEEKSYNTISEAILDFEASKYGKKTYEVAEEKGHNQKAPKSGSEAASNEDVLKYFTKGLNFLNDKADPFVVQISADELGTLADSAYDIKGRYINGVANLTFKIPDDEAAEATKFIEDKYEVKVVEDYKLVELKGDAVGIFNLTGGSTADYKRVVKVEEVEKTTTSTTTTSTTTSTTTASTTDNGEGTTTTTTDNGEGTTTTTSTTDNGEGTTTTTTDNGEGTTTTTTDNGEGTGTTTTTTDNGEGKNTTTTTTDNGEGTDTTTTASTTGSVTTTRSEERTVANFTLATADPGVGFYLNIDKEFNKGQIKSVSYSLDKMLVFIGENGEEVGSTLLGKGTPVDVTADVDFGGKTPANVFENGKKEFKHELKLYASKQIAGADGKIIAEEGSVLKDANGAYLTVDAYVGVKGDGNLDFMADATDATLVLTWYAGLSTGKKADETVFSDSELIKEENANGEKIVKEGYDKNLDEFAAFLCDVDNEKAEGNYGLLKPARTIDASDASFILAMYANVSTGGKNDRESWNNILGEDLAVK